MTDADLHAAWDEVHASIPDGWHVGRPGWDDHHRQWSMYAFDPSAEPMVGRRSREWTAVGQSELHCVREMARRLGGVEGWEMDEVTSESVVPAARRWIVALELLLAAESAIRRGGVADATIAVVLADTAAETTLGLTAALKGKRPKKQNNHDSLIQAAEEAVAEIDGVEWPPYLFADLSAVHKARNIAVHDGGEQPVATAQLAVSAARRALSVLSSASAAFPSLPAATGIAAAVASIIGPVPFVADQLRLAEAALHEDDAEAARRAGAIALAATLKLVEPRLGPGRRGPRAKVQRLRSETRSGAPHESERYVDAAFDRVFAWVVPMALGLRPADYDRMRGTLGSAYAYGRGDWMVPEHDPVSGADLRWAVEMLATVVFRMWSMGGLKP